MRFRERETAPAAADGLRGHEGWERGREAAESRPERRLYVPASDGADKRWARYVLDDPRVRLKVGDRIYPGRATRVTDEALRGTLIEAARGKYPRIVGGMDDEVLARIWVFRVDSAP